AVEAEAALGGGDEAAHDHRDVVYIQTRAVEGAVARFAAQQLDDTAHPALANGILAFHDQTTGTHAHDRAVPAAVEWQRRLGHLIFRCGRADGQKTRADPLHQVITGHI